MSGPKSSSYSVDDAIESEQDRHRQAVGEARAAAERRDQFLERLAQLEAVYGSLGIHVTKVRLDPSQDRVQIIRFTNELRESLSTAEANLQTALDQVRAEAISESLTDMSMGDEPELVDTDALRRSARSSESDTSDTERGKHQANRRRLARARAEILELPSPQRSALQPLLDRAQVADPSEMDRLVLELEARLDRVAEHSRQQQRDAHLAQELLAELLGYEEDSEAQQAATEVRAYTDGTLSMDNGKEQRFRNVIEQARRRAQDRYVRSALTEAFEEMEYQVDEDFETVITGDHIELIPDQSEERWQGYAVRAHIGEGEIRWHLVRDDDNESNPELEAELERSWCEDLNAAHATIRERHGINAAIHSAHAPGAFAVMSASGVNKRTRTKSRRQRRKGSGASREREL